MIFKVDILELKFEGNGVNPSNVKPREVAELILNFEKSLLSTIKEQNPEIDTDQLLFSFEEIRNESLDLKFLTRSVREVVLSAYTLITTSLNSGDFSLLNSETISSLKSITRFSRKYECSGQFNLNGKVLSTFTPTTEISVDKPRLIKGETTIFGKLIDSGGENPNVHIRITEDQVLIFDTTEAHAKALATKLYEKVALSGIAKWDAKTMKILDFKLADILEYKAGNAAKAIAELRNITSGFWDKYNDNDDINQQLLRD